MLLLQEDGEILMVLWCSLEMFLLQEVVGVLS